MAEHVSEGGWTPVNGTRRVTVDDDTSSGDNPASGQAPRHHEAGEQKIDIARCVVDEEAARAMMERLRWKDVAICPHCRVEGMSRRMKTTTGRPGLWRCNACRKQYTVTVGTALSTTHVPLHLWVYLVHMLCSSSRGVTASEIAQELGVSYNSARAMLDRIDRALHAAAGGVETYTCDADMRWKRGRVSFRSKTSTEICHFLISTESSRQAPSPEHIRESSRAGHETATAD